MYWLWEGRWWVYDSGEVGVDYEEGRVWVRDVKEIGHVALTLFCVSLICREEGGGGGGDPL